MGPESIHEAGDRPLNPEVAERLNETVIDATVDGMAHDLRVDTDREGDQVSKILTLDPDLDPAMELLGLKKVVVSEFYALAGEPQDLLPKISYEWERNNGSSVQVSLQEGAEPLIMEWAERLGENEEELAIGHGEPLSESEADELEKVFELVKGVFEEQGRLNRATDANEGGTQD